MLAQVPVPVAGAALVLERVQALGQVQALVLARVQGPVRVQALVREQVPAVVRGQVPERVQALAQVLEQEQVLEPAQGPVRG